jgi:hypothetical protein
LRGRAAAYCVAHSCNPDDRSGPSCKRDARTGCAIDGAELYRPNGCIYIGIEEGSGQSLGLSDDNIEEVILDAFALWTEVDCEEGPPSIFVQSVGAMPGHEPFACTLVPDANVDLWIMTDELPGSGAMSESTTTGVTRPTFIEDTGVILDADVLLNQRWLAAQNEAMRDRLLVVALHEAGHTLGLAHSLDPGSLMHRDYDVTSSAGLTQDDIEGICELFPPRDLRCQRPIVRAHAAAIDQAACDEAYRVEMEGDVVVVEQEDVRVRPACGVAIAGSGGASARGPWWLVLAVAFRRLRRKR